MTPATATAPPTGTEILLVDDDRLVLSTISNGLSRAGYRVQTAESTEDAEVQLAGGQRPDLAVVDVKMPGQGGLYLARRLNEFHHIPFMMLSAYDDPTIVEEATRMGALGYAVKPISIAQLVPAVEAALARASDLQELRMTREQLQHALDVERSVCVATGILMVEYKLERRDALALMRDTARKQRRKLAHIADEIVRARESLNLGLRPTQFDSGQ